MIEDIFKAVNTITQHLNKRFDDSLLDNEKTLDMEDTIREDLPKAITDLSKGIEAFNVLKLDSLMTSKDEEYTLAYYNVIVGLGDLQSYLNELESNLVELNKNFMYQSGEITKEEYESSDEIVLEDEE